MRPVKADVIVGAQEPGMNAGDVDFFNKETSDQNGWGADEDFFANDPEASQVEDPASLSASGAIAIDSLEPAQTAFDASPDPNLQGEDQLWGIPATASQYQASSQRLTASDWIEEDVSESFFNDEIESGHSDSHHNNAQQPTLQKAAFTSPQQYFDHANEALNDPSQAIEKSSSAEELDWLNQPIGDGDWA